MFRIDGGEFLFETSERRGDVTCAQGAWHRAAMPRHLQQCHGDIAKHGDIAP
jgi:hypothetical protein